MYTCVGLSRPECCFKCCLYSQERAACCFKPTCVCVCACVLGIALKRTCYTQGVSLLLKMYAVYCRFA